MRAWPAAPMQRHVATLSGALLCLVPDCWAPCGLVARNPANPPLIQCIKGA
eukprot:CAMPEP_0174300520 /NCGR_PEP_ID=MMETSP0809-20121228/58505_1 /TAXON_ID=73025 ORGANISM="Eutreptiella gymnastica-like, Strain CCMP1594" /NCGR_SAMPLE_ID=MMETSP0809 /ASSEMBLY_ACC=CAM_ASM_000658 /LENGTH=50 /DNA_ID=CAMNT_0015406099 /DNA_START=176 /DNA_END=328 /DNA_ORIENTATION=+